MISCAYKPRFQGREWKDQKFMTIICYKSSSGTLMYCLKASKQTNNPQGLLSADFHLPSLLQASASSTAMTSCLHFVFLLWAENVECKQHFVTRTPPTHQLLLCASCSPAFSPAMGFCQLSPQWPPFVQSSQFLSDLSNLVSQPASFTL